MSFDVETQGGENITISQSQLVARVNYCSDFWGAVIGFAMSPFGVMAIAILPCIAIVAFEIVKFIMSKRPVPQVETVKLQEEAPVYVPPESEEHKLSKASNAEAKKAAVPSLSDNGKVPHNRVLDSSHGKTDDFTERLRSKKNIAASADNIKDRADFSAGARKRMESDRAEQQKEKKAKTENIKNENALPEMTEKTVAAEVTHSGSEPDISLVFRDDEDKRYDIDDILADIEKRHH